MRRWVIPALLFVSLLSVPQAQAANLVNNGNGTVTDNRTGLMWQQGEPGYMTWGSALSYCEGLSLGGHSDWRLPNIKELESLTDDTRHNPAIDPSFFPNAYASYYWSSTTYANYPYIAWGVDFGNGFVGGNYKNGSLYVRCVRGGQSGSFGSSGIFFSTIPTQAANTPFSVTVSAYNAAGNLDTGFNGEVQLSASIGEVTPFIAYLVNGSATVTLKLDSPGNYVTISGNGGGKWGESNPFVVTGGAQGSACLYGVVMDLSDAPVAESTVTLVDGANKTTFVTAGDGRYSFANLQPGRYMVKADDALGILGSEEVPVKLGNGQAVKQGLKIIGSLCNTAALTPVMLVPGIMGSSSGWGGLYPTLPRNAPDWNDSVWQTGSWGLHDPLDNPGWRKLVAALKDAGYKRGCTLFPVPYDWRMDLDDAAGKYLKPWIDEAKRIAGTEKVNIIAHSMGGLLTRAYIQGGDYPDPPDVDKFAMVGTPNHGAASAYYLYSGGEPKTADKVSLLNTYPGLDNVKTWLAQFYQRTSVLMLGIYKMSDYPYQRQMYQLAQKHIPSAKQLLPTYDFLVPNGSLDCEKNQWLIDLNNSSSRNRMGQKDDTGKVRTKIFAGKNYYTVNNILVGPRMCSLATYYKDGSPFWSFFDSIGSVPDGDGTVLTGSASLGSLVSFTDERNGQHSGLIETYKDDLVKFITDATPSVAALKTEINKTANLSLLSAIDSEFALSVIGRVQPCLVDSMGRKSGIDPVTNLMVDEIPQSSVSMDLKGGSITIGNAADGIYTMYLKDAYQEDYTLSVSFTNDSDTFYRRKVGFNNANTTSYTIAVASGSTEKVAIQGLPDAPTNLKANAVGTTSPTTRLSWTASTTPGVTGYNVYARLMDEPTLSLIGTSAGTTYDTDHPWALDSTVPSRIYAVSALKADGTESFFDTMAENRDYLVAGFTANTTTGNAPLTVTFTDSSTGTITDRQWDFDGDGVIDSTDTNPVHTFNAPGSYTVSLTVSGPGGSDFQTRTNYITVDSVPLDTIMGSTPASPTNSTQASFTFTASKANSTFECALDDGAFAVCTSPKDYASLSEGSHTFQVRAVDLAGNPDPTPATYTWTIDTTPPTVNIGAPSATLTKEGPVSYVVTYGGADTITLTAGNIALNKTGTADGTSAVTGSGNIRTVTISGITGNGALGISIAGGTANDTAGNSAPASTASITFSVDNTPPDTTITTMPVNPSNSVSPSFGFASTEANSTFECKLDSGSFAACTSPKSYTGLAEGNHTFSVRATDLAGNTDLTPASSTWTIDLTPPDTTITTKPDGTTNSTTANFTFTATEASSTFECRLDSGIFAACTSPKQYTGLAEGSHTFSVQATDLAGNTDLTPASYTWTIDMTPPVEGTLNTSVDYGQVSLTWSGFSDTGSGIKEYRLIWSPTSVPASCAAGTPLYAGSATSFVHTGLTNGSTYYYRLCAIDNAGNSSVGVTASAKVADTSPPAGSITINSGAPYTKSTKVSLTLSATDPSGVAKMCISNTDTCNAWKTFATAKKWSLVKGDGIKTVNVWFIDKAGIVNSTPYVATIILDSKLMLLTVNPVTTPTSETTQTITGTVEEGAMVQVTSKTASSGAASVSGGTWSYSVTGLRTGANSVVVTATDVTGNTAKKTVKITVK